MCTAVTYSTQNHYFGRTFDWEVSYGEKIAITPRNYPLFFRKMPALEQHYALIGMAVVVPEVSCPRAEVSGIDATQDVRKLPLYYDAINEKGLGMAGLNFPNNTDYKDLEEGKDNITPFEFIPWILGQCETVEEARGLLSRINLVKIPFSEQYPLSPLHWIIADKKEVITVECVKEGLMVYDNPVGVLTNNPPFPTQMFYLTNFMQLSREEPVSRFAEGMKLQPYSRGMGSMGMPGDWSSASRFVRCTFAKMNAVSGESEEESVSQFFHILGTVEQKRGCVLLEKRKDGQDVFEISIYTSCCDQDKGRYYYKTYDNSAVNCVDMHRENLDGRELIVYELKRQMDIVYQNQRE